VVKKLGVFPVGRTNVEVELTVGIGSESWCDAVAVLLHEVFELLFLQRNASYIESSNWNRSSSQYLFLFHHEEFCEICEFASTAILEIMPKLEAVHKRRHPKRKKS
jgi:hypothetical protein